MAYDLALPASSIVVEYRKWLFGNRETPSSWGEWRPVAKTVHVKEYDKLAIRFDGPSGARLCINGIEPIASQEEWRWTEKTPLWFPGEYRMQVFLHDDICIWESRIVVAPQNPAFQHFGPMMAEELETWIPGLTQEAEGGVISHARIPWQRVNADVALTTALLNAMERVVLRLEGEFRWIAREPQLDLDTRDNRSLLKGLFWTQRFLEDRISLLNGTVDPSSEGDRSIRLRQLHQLHQRSMRLMQTPAWHGVGRPRTDDRPTQRAYRLQSYQTVFQRLKALQRVAQGPSKSDPELTRIRSTPDIFQLWVLLQVLLALKRAGWLLVDRPAWANPRHWRGGAEPLSVTACRFLFRRAEWTLRLDYDTPLPDNEDDTESSDGLWVSGQHNRPDFLLRFQKEGCRPQVRIFEAKYRPRHYVWPDQKDFKQSSKGQLQQYWASLMHGGEDHLHPPVVCVIPQHDPLVWRAAQHPDIEFLAMNPSQDRDHWSAILATRLVPGTALEGSSLNV